MPTVTDGIDQSTGVEHLQTNRAGSATMVFPEVQQRGLNSSSPKSQNKEEKVTVNHNSREPQSFYQFQMGTNTDSTEKAGGPLDRPSVLPLTQRQEGNTIQAIQQYRELFGGNRTEGQTTVWSFSISGFHGRYDFKISLPSPFLLFFSLSLFPPSLSLCLLPSLHISSLPPSLSFSLHPSLSPRLSYVTGSSFRGNRSMCSEAGMGEKQDKVRAVCTPGS